MTFTPKHWTAFVLGAAALAASFVIKDQALPVMAVAIVGLLLIVVTTASGGGESLAGLVEAVRSSANGEKVRAPASASADLERVYEELSAVASQRKKDVAATGERQMQIDEAEKVLDDLTRKLAEGVRTQLSAAEETSKQIAEMAKAISDIAQGVEALATSAE